jgi:phospholipid/cholesterol/gamma-HCH transport system substrate-binding protein
MRLAVADIQNSIENMRAMTEDLRAVSSDFRELDFSQRIDRVGANVEALTLEATNFTARATEVLDTIQVTSGPGGLMDNVRQTLDNTNRAMANMVDNTEALKRNWFFRGFFNDRGYFSIDAVSLEEYQNSRFLADRQRITRRLGADGMFNASGTDLTEAGRQQVDTVMAEYLRYSREDPLMIEAYTSGPDPETLLTARDWAVAVREYLINRFELSPSYLGIMPMMVSDLPSDEGQGDGIGLVLFASRGR